MAPICFVVMPFGVKETGMPLPAPGTVDFDRLWREAFQPALTALGYQAARADEDRSALIIHEMIERLYYADLVIADVSIANANVYYEVGLRHAARHDGCVLIASNWAKPVFDLGQMRRIPYDNPGPAVTPEEAASIQEVLTSSLPNAFKSQTPPPIIINGLGAPTLPANRARSAALAEELAAADALHFEMETIRELGKDDRLAQARRFLEQHPAASLSTAYVAVEVLAFVRDVLGDWKETLAFIQALPGDVQALPFVIEQRALAEAKSGDAQQAIVRLKKLIKDLGSTPEREGLLGGRYKKLAEAQRATDPRTAAKTLDLAITHYEAGMYLDLNQYFCSCNLPALYRERAEPRDEDKAIAAAAVSRAACERVIKLNLKDDGWLRQTLLGLAFAECNPTAAEELLPQVQREGAALWSVESTLSTLNKHMTRIERDYPSLAPRFRKVLEALHEMT